MRRTWLALCALLLALPAAAQGTNQSWEPDRPVRIIVPFPPGGATDLIARIFAERASRDLAQKWVVENRSGANGNIGMDVVAKSPPDGYTLGACTIGNCAINASIYARMPFDIERDLRRCSGPAR
jgi:tripartite-type tricarboxylate transporter receptor subunit TctC